MFIYFCIMNIYAFGNLQFAFNVLNEKWVDNIKLKSSEINYE